MFPALFGGDGWDWRLDAVWLDNTLADMNTLRFALLLLAGGLLQSASREQELVVTPESAQGIQCLEQGAGEGESGTGKVNQTPTYQR